MLRISKLADYGTMIMVHLAKLSDGTQTAKDIASDIHLAVPTVSKLLKLLAGAGLLQSHRGVKGGYCLAIPDSHISVADIIQAVEGHQGLTECSHDDGNCSLEAICQVRDHWQVINHAIHSALSSVKLSDLIKTKLRAKNIDVSKIKRIATS